MDPGGRIAAPFTSGPPSYLCCCITLNLNHLRIKSEVGLRRSDTGANRLVKHAYLEITFQLSRNWDIFLASALFWSL